MLKFCPFLTEATAVGDARLRAPFAMTMMITIIATMRGGYG